MRLKQATLPEFVPQKAGNIWPVNWIHPDRKILGSHVIAYRREFHLKEAQRLRIHVSADQRYRLFVNGNLEGEGPSRSDQHTWYYESYDLDLEAGTNRIVALVWSLEPVDGIMPAAQITIEHGFVLAADAPYTGMISTGLGNWEYKQLSGIDFIEPGLEGAGSLAGSVVQIDGNHFPLGVERGLGEDWKLAKAGDPARSGLSGKNWGGMDFHILTPTPLAPPYLERHNLTNLRAAGTFSSTEERNLFKIHCPSNAPIPEDIRKAFLENRPITIKANRCQWLLFDLENYFCGYPEIRLEKGSGSTIGIYWAESLFEDDPDAIAHYKAAKGNRNAVEGKYFKGRGDTFRMGQADHDVTFTSFWWSCGRYVVLKIETGDQDLIVHEAGFRETRYPQEFVAEIELANESFAKSRDIMWRTLQMCAHETYMDCPYYEQINYAGDTRIQALASYAVSGEFNLARKCIQHFNNSLLPIGLTQARTPSFIRQVIPQFSLFWICMVHDYAKWKGDPEFIRKLLPNIRCVIDTFLQHVMQNGLLRCPDGWDWVDWVPLWEEQKTEGNFHPFGPDGSSAVNHMQLIYTLGMVENLERWIGRTVSADYYRSQADKLWESGCKAYWNESKGLFAATTDHRSFNEHTQCFAVLCQQCDDKLLTSIRTSMEKPVKDLTRSTFYFQFYLFLAYVRLGLPHRIIEHFDHWGAMGDMGCKTTLERFDPSRSDCHAWSAHPLYHAVTSIGGIRPLDWGFSKVLIAPALQTVASANFSVPHAKGTIKVSWSREGNQVSLSINLPEDLEGLLFLDGEEVPLSAGNRCFDKRIDLDGLKQNSTKTLLTSLQ